MRIRLAIILGLLGLATFTLAGAEHGSAVKAPHNVVLIIVDGMHNVNERQYCQYQYGTPTGASFHDWPYQAYMTTWDTTTYDRFAWDSPWVTQRYDRECFDPRWGYDPACGGCEPSSGEATEADSYFLTTLPRWGRVRQQGAGQPATDSAAAATAFATGYKTDTGNVNWLPGDPEGGQLKTIAEQFREQRGGSVGIGSTVMFSHATPACFASHNVYRGRYEEIAEEILTQCGFDVIIGSGHPEFTLNSDGTPRTRYCPPEHLAAIKADENYLVVEKIAGADNGLALRNAAAIAAENGLKLCGVFGAADKRMEPIMPRHNPGAPEWDVPVDDPHASDIAVAALEVLGHSDNGFFLMVEQGDLDWANHANDYAGGLGCMHDADLCARAVVDWINRPGDGVTLENTSVIVVPDHTHYIRQDKWLGIGELPEQVVIDGDRRDYEGSYRYPGGEPVYHSTSHTNELGNVYVIGGGIGAILAGFEGDWYPGTRIVDNTQIYEAMARWLRVEQ